MHDDELDQMGPVDYLVIEFPPGSRMTGEGLPLLVDLVDRRIVRVLDLTFVRKSEDGIVLTLDLTDLGDDGDGLAVFAGASSGLLDPADIAALADVLLPGSTAAVLLYENRWAAPLAVALRRAGAQFVDGGRIPVQALLAALEAAEAVPARDEDLPVGVGAQTSTEE